MTTPPRRQTRRAGTAVAAVVLLFLAACGGDDSDDEAEVTVPVVDRTGGLVAPAAEALVYENYQGGHVQVDVARTDLNEDSVPRLKAVLTYDSSVLDPEECHSDMHGFKGRWGNARTTEYEFDCGPAAVAQVVEVTLLPAD